MEIQFFLTFLQAVVTLLVGYVGIKIKKREEEKEKQEQERRKESEAIKQGIRAVLRDRILQAYNHFRKVGCITIAQQENINNMYMAYHNLGGNGVITSVYMKVMELPHDKSGDGS